MVKIEAVLYPEEGELVWIMLNHAASRLAREAAAATAAGETAGQDSAESRGAAFAGSAGTESCDAASDRSPMGGPGSPDGASRGCNGSPHGFGDAPVPHALGPDDSAESPVAAKPCCAAASAGTGTPAGEQREWTGPSAAGCPAWELPVEETEPTQAGDLAAYSEVRGRSLLDRLLEEADALRSIEPVAAEGAAGLGDSLAPSPSQRDAEPWLKPFARRGASVLRDRAAAARTAFNRADALVDLAQGYLRGDQPDRSPIEVTLSVPASVLRDELTDPVEIGELGEALVSREAARRLSCDAGVVEIIEDEQGAPLSVGRKRRTIAGALRRALHRRDRSCTYPGCTNRMFLEGHHIKHWADGGETSLSNTALLCRLHHRHVHELGYTVELGPDQRPRFRDPQGRLVAVAPELPAPADLGWPRIRAANEPLAIDAGTIAGPWDGTPVDYPRIVGHLATADGLA